MTKTHTYRGRTIYPCERAPGEHRGRWIVQASIYGMQYSDELCGHYQTLADARQAIDDGLDSIDGGQQ